MYIALLNISCPICKCKPSMKGYGYWLLMATHGYLLLLMAMSDYPHATQPPKLLAVRSARSRQCSRRGQGRSQPGGTKCARRHQPAIKSQPESPKARAARLGHAWGTLDDYRRAKRLREADDCTGAAAGAARRSGLDDGVSADPESNSATEEGSSSPLSRIWSTTDPTNDG